MKRFTSLYYIALSALLMLTACQSDETAKQGGGQQKDGMVTVGLRISPAGSSSANARTRADWRDTWGTDDEMMNLWTVVIVDNATDAVKEIQSCKPTGTYTVGTDDDREVDIITELPTGIYRFYSFANIGAASLESLLGLPDGSVPVPSANDVIVKKAIGDVIPGNANPISDLGHIYPRGSNNKPQNVTPVEDRTIGINGNNFDPTADDNGYGAKGIPMSNVQTKEITTNITFDLIVIRLLAKIEVQVYNDGDEDITIESISLTDVTKNADNNLKLLPSLTAEGANTMSYQHKDIQPNLGAEPSEDTRANLTFYPAEGQKSVAHTGHKSTDATPNPVTFTFYVNESVAPDNGSGLFYLSLGMKTGEGTTVEYSHALINQEGETANDNDAWNYISRNDYRIIPVILTDWLFRIEPLAFTPIAGYPAILLSSDAHKATFSTGGMIALQPFVKKRTETTWRDLGDTEVTFGVEVKDNVTNEVDEEASWAASIRWKNGDGDTKSGTDKIVKTPFTYDPVTKCIIGEMNFDKVTGSNKTALTITLKLGPESGNQYTYSFTCDIII